MKRLHLPLLNANPDANGGGAPPAAAPATSNPAPATSAVPSMPEIFAGMMGAPAPEPSNSNAAAPPAGGAPSVQQPPAGGPSRAPNGQFTPKATDAGAPAGDKKTDAQPDVVADFMKRFYSEAPEWMKDDTKGLTTWKQQRDFMEKTLATVRDMTASELALKQELEALRAGKAPPAPDGNAPEALTKLQIDLQAAQAKYDADFKEWNEEKARREMSGLPAFRAEFEGKKAAVVESAQAIAKEAGIPDDTLKAILGATSEYSLAKQLEGIADKTAAGLLGEKARAYMDLGRKQQSTLNAADPLAELEKWRRIEEQTQGVMGARFTDALKAQFNAAVPQVVQALTGKDGDIFFRTQGGQAVLGMIANRFANGMDLKPAEVLQTMAQAQAYVVYRQMASSMAAKVAELEKTLKQYEAADPARVAAGASAPAGDQQPASGGFLGGLFSSMLPANNAQ